MSEPRGKCPKCGKTMCEQFDDKELGIMIVSIPNGQFKCNWCGYDSRAPQTEQGGTKK